MNNRIIRITVLILLLGSFVTGMTGCRPKQEPYIVSMNDKSLYLSDFLYDIYLVEQDAGRMAQYDKDISEDSYWDIEYQGTTLRQIAKNSILAGVVMDYILADQATKTGITLTDRELADNEAAIEAILAGSSGERLVHAGLTREVLTAAYNRKALADKYHKELEKDFKINESGIRDSITMDQYKEYKTECLFIPTVKTINKELVPLGKEASAAAYTTISEARKQLTSGSGFDELLKQYPDLAYYTRDFIYGDSFYEEEYQEVAAKLQNSSYSSPVKTKYGYYIIHMLDNNSDARYEQAVNDAVEAEKEKQFRKLYDKMKSQYEITIDFNYWDTIMIGSVTLP